ncbi:MAG: hypothetical protein AMJ61_04600 [Desulfobacterales bacterium SG8_35_2]|jgi:hypothetical protein|nr:MAG: hypothetical protein AMJ61_04600 [Desulfobacterales bacterium SG8_35_2]
MQMNAYLDMLEDDINKVRDLSCICRGEWCRYLESEVDTLLNELVEFKICEGDFESNRIEGMKSKIWDAYRNLAPDIHTW